jgi:hypothetical protein
VPDTRPFWNHSGEREQSRFLGQLYEIRARGEETGGAFSLTEVVTPRDTGPPPHVHEREDGVQFLGPPPGGPA